MSDLAASMTKPVGGFDIQGLMMPYNTFMPRLYNWCKSLGFEAGKIMPSRAFCSDESQGYPVIMVAKHFAAFPFSHGRVGGIVSTKRHGPHADHGEDLMIIQASHVGYDPATRSFGIYRRLQTHDHRCSANCGKILYTLQWYQDEYQFAQRNILLHNHQGEPCIIIDNHLLRGDVDNSLILHLKKLLKSDWEGRHSPVKMLSTSKVYRAADSLVESIGLEQFNQPDPTPICKYLSYDLFYYRRDIPEKIDEKHNLEYNLFSFMPQIVTDPWPGLLAAQINTQIEFDRTYRSIVRENAYHGKRLMFISGLNIDISPQDNQIFPLTQFVPWAAFIQDTDGSFRTLEQKQVYDELCRQDSENPEQIDLEEAIQKMTEATKFEVDVNPEDTSHNSPCVIP